VQAVITIITSVLEGDAHIDRCVRNVIEQDCSSVEHLIIDLTLASSAKGIVGDLAQRHENITYLSKTGAPLNEVLNHAIQIANGPIIGFLQNRSAYGPRTLKRIVKIADGLKAPSLILGNCAIQTEEGEHIHANRPKHINYIDVLAGRTYPYYPVAYFYHKRLHDTVGTFYPGEADLIHFEFLLRLLQSTPVRYFNEFWGTHISAEKFHANVKKAIDQGTQHLREQYIQQLSFTKQLHIRAIKFKDRLSTRMH